MRRQLLGVGILVAVVGLALVTDARAWRDLAFLVAFFVFMLLVNVRRNRRRGNA